MKQLLLIFVLFCSVIAAATAQQQVPLQFRYRQDVSVATQAGQLANPWSGGLNTPQFSTIDLDKDGQEDLFIFDRQLRKVYTWLAVQQNGQWQYQYAPAYEALFPADLEHWVLLRDYDCDGQKDIFTSSPLGIRVFRQEAGTGGQLQFTLAEEALFYRNNQVNMQMQSADIPAIADIDNDGDLDILISEFSRGYTLELYRNQQAEQNLACGTLRFEQQTNWWGGITECDGCNNFLFGAHCRVAAPLHTGHDGSALLLLDMDADGDKDLVMGGVQCNTLVLMENEGSVDNAVMRSFLPDFPAVKPATFTVFPAAYYEDVTFDGVPDMLVAPQATDELYNINFGSSTWLYRNEGAANRPDFTYEQEDFLQEQMIDIGEGAFPAFADMDADGDLDLLIGNAKAYRNGEYSATLHYYRNTGTATAPAFELVTNDFLNLQGKGLFNLKPVFADMNGDGLTDLVLAFQEQEADFNRIGYIPNKAAQGQAALYSFEDLQTLQVIAEHASPTLSDVDGDGNPDLLLSHGNGGLSFYRNTGSASSPVFAEEQTAFGGITPDFSRRFLHAATADVDGDGTTDLLTVDNSGFLKVYRDLSSALDGDTLVPETELLEHEFVEGLQASRFGKGLSIAAAPLGGENTLYLAVGTQGGGLFLLEQTSGSTPKPTSPEAHLALQVYPNPADRSRPGAVQVKASEPVAIHVYDAIGKRVYRTSGNHSGNHALPLQHLRAGMYIIRATTQGGAHASAKLVIR